MADAMVNPPPGAEFVGVAVPPIAGTTDERISRDVAVLAAGTVVTVLAAYGYVALGTRVLGAVAFAPLSVLWTFWAAGAAVLGFPIEHWITRTARADGDEHGIRRILPALFGVVGLLAAVLGAGAWLGSDRLFGRGDLVFPAFVAVITVGTALTATLRGVLAARARFVALGTAIAAENCLRLLLGASVAVLGATPTSFAVALVCGPLVALAWPSAFRLEAAQPKAARASSAAFIGGTGMAALMAQLVLTGGPVALALIGGPRAHITALFAALALFRLPYVLALGLATRMTRTLTGLVMDGRAAVLARVLRWILGMAVLATAGGAGFGYVAGPALLRLVFGPDVTMASSLLAWVGAGNGLALGTLMLTLVLLARARSGMIAVTWTIALGAATVWIARAGLEPLARVVVGFVLAEIVAFIGLFLSELRPRSRMLAANSHETLAAGPLTEVSASRGSLARVRRGDRR